jgi:hypothetical protein
MFVLAKCGVLFEIRTELLNIILKGIHLQIAQSLPLKL